MNVSEPLYGWLTDDMQLDTGQTLTCGDYIQPRCEPEVAFLLAEDLAGPHVLAAHVLAATALVFPAIDVLDSRFAGYKFTGSDVIADNSSCAGFVFGGQGVDPRGIDLRLVGCAFEKNGVLLGTAAGAAVLGHPAASVAWMVRRMAARGQGMRAGPDRHGGSAHRGGRRRTRGHRRRTVRPARHRRARLPLAPARGEAMPFVQVTILEGRTVEQKHDLMRRLTAATAEALGGDPQRIRVAIYEVSADDWAIGGVPVSVLRPSG